MIDVAGFSDLRNYIKRRVAYARYRAGNTWTKVPLSSCTVRSDGIVRAALNINNNGSTITVTRVELYNTDQELWAHQDCSIKVESTQSGILFWFDFRITESEDDV